jgi:hypothetical protein
MLFLLNETILDLNLRALIPPAEAPRFAGLSFDQVMQQGADMFRQNPLLATEDVMRAKRLAALIVVKAPKANAAFFDTAAPQPGKRPRPPQVVSISIEVMATLYGEFLVGKLTPELAHRKVWSLLPA